MNINYILYYNKNIFITLVELSVHVPAFSHHLPSIHIEYTTDHAGVLPRATCRLMRGFLYVMTKLLEVIDVYHKNLLMYPVIVQENVGQGIFKICS